MWCQTLTEMQCRWCVEIMTYNKMLTLMGGGGGGGGERVDVNFAFCIQDIQNYTRR